MADSDSENEGILTNIQRLVIRPPGHTGKAKKGHICFDGSYETMNLGRVDFITNQEYDLYIRPDTANPRSRFWFHFTVENTQKDQRVIFNVVNLSKARTLFCDGLTPVVKSTSRPRWQRMAKNYVFYYKSPIHHKNFVLSFAFIFDREDERYYFAVAQPYSLSRYNMYMKSVLESEFDFLRTEQIGQTIQERPLELITLSDPINHEPALRKRRFQRQHEASSASESGSTEKKITYSSALPKVVVIMARIHASDAPASFIIQGLIDFLTSNHDVAESLRTHIIFKILPVMNPDGVFMGNTRCNLLGQDLNRNWHKTNKFSHPTVYAAKRLIHGLDRDQNVELDLILDIHAHASLLGTFVVGNAYDDVYRFERHTVFPKILSQICPDFSIENTVYNNDASKEGTARRYFCDNISPEVNSYTLEASLYGYKDPHSDDVVPYTDDMYCRIGRNVARALWDYYKILGVIPLDIEGPASAHGADKSTTCVRSFNLLRLREIEQQRNQSAFTFDVQEDDGGRIDHGDDKDKSNTANVKFSYKKFITDNNPKSQVSIPMSVKTIVYSSDDDDSRYFPEFASHQKSRKFAEDIEYFKTKDINDENVVNLNEGRFSMATSMSTISTGRVQFLTETPELIIRQGIQTKVLTVKLMHNHWIVAARVKSCSSSKRSHRTEDSICRPLTTTTDDEEEFFRCDDQQKRRSGLITRPTSAPKKFVMLNGLSEVDIGVGPIARSYNGTPIRHGLYNYQRPNWDDKIIPSHFVVPEIIVTPMSVSNAATETEPEKIFRRINYVSTSNQTSFQKSSNQVYGNGTKVQKVGGGGHISIACRKAPRPQSLLPSLPAPTLTCFDIAFVSGVHFSAQQRTKVDKKIDEIKKDEQKK